MAAAAIMLWSSLFCQALFLLKVPTILQLLACLCFCFFFLNCLNHVPIIPEVFFFFFWSFFKSLTWYIVPHKLWKLGNRFPQEHIFDFGISVWFPYQVTKWFSYVFKGIAVDEGALRFISMVYCEADRPPIFKTFRERKMFVLTDHMFCHCNTKLLSKTVPQGKAFHLFSFEMSNLFIKMY